LFISLNLFTNLQTYVWSNENLSFPTDAHGNPDISSGELWQDGWQLNRSAVKTWTLFPSSGSIPAQWYPDAAYRWQGNSTGTPQTTYLDFPWSAASQGGPTPDWIRGSSPTLVQNGVTLATLDATATAGAVLYDSTLTTSIASFANSNVSNNAAFYYGFESYEDATALRLVSTNASSWSTCSDSGNRSLLVSIQPSESVFCAWQKPFAPSQLTAGQWLATIHYRIAGSVAARWLLEIRVLGISSSVDLEQGTILHARSLDTEHPGEWITTSMTFDLQKAISQTTWNGHDELLVVFDISAKAQAQQVFVYVDNISFAPIEAAQFGVSVYDSATKSLVTQATPADYNFYERWVYDSRGQNIAKLRRQDASQLTSRVSFGASYFSPGVSSSVQQAPAQALEVGQIVFSQSPEPELGAINPFIYVIEFLYQYDGDDPKDLFFKFSFGILLSLNISSSGVSLCTLTAPFLTISNVNITDGTFHHIRVTAGPVQRIELAVDDSATHSSSGPSFVPVPFQIQASGSQRILEVRSWMFPLPSPLPDIYQRLTGAEQGLIGYWPFNGLANDRSFTHNNAVVLSGTYVQTELLLGCSGNFDQAREHLIPNVSLQGTSNGIFDTSISACVAGLYFDFRDQQNDWNGGVLLDRLLILNSGSPTASYPIAQDLEGMGIRAQLQGWVDVYTASLEQGNTVAGIPAVASDLTLWGAWGEVGDPELNLYAFNVNAAGTLSRSNSASSTGVMPILGADGRALLIDPLHTRLFGVFCDATQDSYELYNFTNTSFKSLGYSAPSKIFAPILCADNRVYFVDSAVGLYSVDITNVDQASNFFFQLLRTFSSLLAGASCAASPTSNPAATYIALTLNGTASACVVRYSVFDESVKKALVAGVQFDTSPAVADSGWVFLIDDGSVLYAYDANLSLAHVCQLTLQGAIVGSLVVGNGLVALADAGGWLWLYDSQLNQVAALDAGGTIAGSPVIHGDKVSVAVIANGQLLVRTYNAAGHLAAPPYVSPAEQSLSIAAFSQEQSDLLLICDGWSLTRLRFGVPSASIAIGPYSVSWDADARQYSLSGTPHSPPPVQVEACGGDFLLLLVNGTLYFYADGQPIFAQPVDALPPSGSTYAIGAPGAAVAARDVILLNNPSLMLGYTDGRGAVRQVQSLAEVVPPTTPAGGADGTVRTCILMGETLHDGLGRAAIQTVTVAKGAGAVQPSAFAFEPGFISDRSVQNPAFSGGPLAGQVQDWVDRSSFSGPTDPQYAYSGRYFESDPTSRLLQSSAPGADFNQASDHSVRYTSGWLNQRLIDRLGTAVGLLAGDLNSKYLLASKRTSLGSLGVLTRATVGTLSGRTLCALSMDTENPETYRLQAKTRTTGAGLLGGQTSMATTQRFLPNVYDKHVQDPNDFVVTRHFNAQGLCIDRQSPDAGLTQYYYDGAGRLRFSQNADQATRNDGGITIYYLYDALSRVTEIGFFDSGWDTTYFSQLCDDLSTTTRPEGAQALRLFQYDIGDSQSFGRLVQVESLNTQEDSGGKVSQNSNSRVLESYAYNSEGQLIAVTTTINAVPYTTQYQYNSTYKVSKIIYHDNFNLVFSYNTQNQLSSVGYDGSSGVNANYYAHYQYSVSGKVAKEYLAEGAIVTQCSYGNSSGQVTQITSYLAADNNSFFTETLDYTDDTSSYQDGNIQKATYAFGPKVGATTKTYQYIYSYDLFARLLEASAYGSTLQDPIPAWSLSSSVFDANSNLQSVMKDQQKLDYSYNSGTNQIQSQSEPSGKYEYTNNGLIKQTPSIRSLVYDQLLQLPVDTRGVAFVYDSRGERAFKNHGNRSITYIRAGGAWPIEELDQDQNKTRYIYGPTGRLIAINLSKPGETARTFFVLKDHLGSTRVVYDANARTVVAYYSYLPYGGNAEQGGKMADKFRYLYTGQEWDPEIALYNYHARQYDPALGRFLTPDPELRFVNPYVYATNNPVNCVDSSGKVTQWSWEIDDLPVSAEMRTAIRAWARSKSANFNDARLGWRASALNMNFVDQQLGALGLPNSQDIMGGANFNANNAREFMDEMESRDWWYRMRSNGLGEYPYIVYTYREDPLIQAMAVANARQAGIRWGEMDAYVKPLDAVRDLGPRFNGHVIISAHGGEGYIATDMNMRNGKDLWQSEHLIDFMEPISRRAVELGRQIHTITLNGCLTGADGGWSNGQSFAETTYNSALYYRNQPWGAGISRDLTVQGVPDETVSLWAGPFEGALTHDNYDRVNYFRSSLGLTAPDFNYINIRTNFW
jgi:RHS repeat-associated protein